MKRTILSLASLIPLTFAGACGGSDSGDCTASGGSNKAQYVVNNVTVPIQKTDYSIDLNGDGHVDNQLGQIIGTLQSQGLNVQDGVNQALMDGSLILLLQESSTDATYQSDTCATTSMQLGALPSGTMTPDFSGMGSFSATGNAAADFNGPVTAGKFSSAPPSTTKMPVTANVLLPLVAGQPPIMLTLQGAHLQYTRSTSGMVTGGQLQGGIKNSDVQMNIVPAVASLLTHKLATDMPPTSTDSQIESLFDTGGLMDPACGSTCKNPSYGDRAGMCATAMDKIIDTCEVATNKLVQNLLSPDVQLFDASGNYAPNKANTMKDSLSLGLGFTAVGAKF